MLDIFRFLSTASVLAHTRMQVHVRVCVFTRVCDSYCQRQVARGINHSNPILVIGAHRFALISDPHGEAFTPTGCCWEITDSPSVTPTPIPRPPTQLLRPPSCHISARLIHTGVSSNSSEVASCQPNAAGFLYRADTELLHRRQRIGRWKSHQEGRERGV